MTNSAVLASSVVALPPRTGFGALHLGASVASTGRISQRDRLMWPIGLAVLGVATMAVALWDLQDGQWSQYYGAATLSMSQSWHNFFFGALDPAGTVTIDKIPGSFWIPALFVRVFGFSAWSVDAPNALALVAAVVVTALTARRLTGSFGGLLAGLLVGATPIFMAVAKSNQPQTFFVLSIALTAWAGCTAIQKASLPWLMLAGSFVALGFQSYMIEAWAVWPALGLAYLFVTGKKFWRRVVDVVAAGLTSTALSLAWVIVVWLVPASQRPYIGGTLSNNPWEMVFGYNALGRFSATQGVGDYESFTPPYSGNPGLFRLFNAQVGSQIAWLIPAAVVAIIALAILRFRVGVLVFLAGWFVTLCAMFSLVAGMHQFYTSALAVPIALLVALAFALARQKQSLWPQLALLGSAVVMACVLAVRTPSYLEWAVPAQLVCAVGAAALIIAADQGWRPARMAWVALPIMAGLALTPVAWSIDTINHPNSINPVAGDGSAVGFGGGFGAGFGAARPGTSNGSRAGTPFGGGLSSPPTAQGGGAGGSSSQSLLSYVTENRDGASYLLAVFGAQNAATYITATGGQEILPIGGFTGVDQVPTLAQFQELVSSGQLHFVQTSGGSFNRNSSAASTATPVSQQISAWVTSTCTAVSGMSSLYRCG